MQYGSTENPTTSVMEKYVPTSNRCLFARDSVPARAGESFLRRTFADGKAKDIRQTANGAPVDYTVNWKSIIWKFVHRKVRRLQMRIAKAVTEGRWNKVKVLQYLLSRSIYAKLWAVKRVTSNKGKHTPGIDGVIWTSAKDKLNATFSLKRRGYKVQPLRRIYIPKRNGKKRPLSIPTMYDRAMQALHKLTLAPIAETMADKNSYGFREGRSCADAVSAAFNALSKPNSATWIIEADITGCYDNISKEWLLNNIPMDKQILEKWLNAGYVENGITYPTIKGTPQGGIISPTLANMTLDGLEKAVHSAVPRRSRVNFIRYADDFIITAKSKRLLKENVKPAVEEFLKQRGLTLAKEKTKITYIKNGFSFLGQTFRKHGNTLHITPAKQGVLALLAKVGTIIRKYVSAPMPALIKKLNETLHGWANYHRHVVSADIFSLIDTYVYEQLWRMIKRRHSNKSKKWLSKKYWSAAGRNNIFAVRNKNASGKIMVYKVIRICRIGIVRHRKIIAEANPYNPDYAEYFWRRRHIKEAKSLDGFTSREMRLNYAG
jgi:RNA-directed DNA polymerase